MKSKIFKGIVAAFGFSLISFAHAAPIIGEQFNIGLNTGYAVGDANSAPDEAVDWFIFDSNGVDAISFYFNRTIANPDLIAGLYSGDTYGFDYVAAGVSSANWSYASAGDYNPSLTFIEFFDDTHNDNFGGPFGDPDFNRVLAAGRYSLALSSLSQGGTYEFITNVQSASFDVPAPSTLAVFALGLLGLARRNGKRQLKNVAVA
ncbi:PEP-CTERM sorting domain-containing protein [Rheinheimera maricola]|uniref:PEP-CTERM sorting domain-containing protein n=1 Tax=Rheinheimera maricola TaxID=2793282 RepID=A0ABS7X5Q8_9GAMM|nr:PEP-CTERM sorting domain-containing protein [Rheinheimera maricola]MBZ9610152.1 PEP-CTERM sorting domain-containing protein [Rheinheimera maricola]